MNVLVVITTGFVPFGGLTTVMMNYYRIINKHSFHIDFASTNSEVDEKLLKELNENGSSYYCLGDRKKHTLSYVIKLNKLLKEKKYNIIHINSNSATASIELCVAKLRGINMRIVHNHTSKCDHIFMHKLLFPFFRKLYTEAIACSKKAGDWIFPDGKYIVLNNGIDVEKYRYSVSFRNKIRAYYGIHDNCMVIGHLGKIYEPKNHSFLIDVFYEYHCINPNSKLLLVGDGVLRSQIEDKVNKLGIKEYVIFAGMQSNVSEYLSAMDIFVFPSIWEGMPLSVIEAQASGLKCILSDRIDTSVNVTNSIKFISIDNGVAPWVDILYKSKIENRVDASDSYIQLIKANNYDSLSNASKLEKIYVGDK